MGTESVAKIGDANLARLKCICCDLAEKSCERGLNFAKTFQILIRINEQVVLELAPQIAILHISDILQYTVTTATTLSGLTCSFATKKKNNVIT